MGLGSGIVSGVYVVADLDNDCATERELAATTGALCAYFLFEPPWRMAWSRASR